MLQALTASAPAKLIISGEHAVLYDQPALAMAVNRYTCTTTTWLETPQISFKLQNLAYAKSYTLQTLQRLARNLRSEYHNFLAGKCNIRNVLKRPFELLQYSVANLLEHLPKPLTGGVEIAVDSNIPIGCGMGSSAAAVLSTLYALSNFLEYSWQPAAIVEFCREAEHLQHGKSSGLDLHLVQAGGCVRFQAGAAQARPIPEFPLFMVNTGKPDSSTGECVMQVAAQMRDPGLQTDFGAITHRIDTAITQQDFNAFKDGIQANHALLNRIGVVPKKVADFIQAIMASNGAAKVCGAGAIAGDNAGIVLIAADPSIERVVRAHGYNLQAIQVDPYGIRII